jgi:hypothetical protein
MTTYYIRADGSNTNTGTGITSGTAWRTLAYACSQADPGDTIYVMSSGGIFYISSEHDINPVGTSGAHITVSNYPEQAPIFDGTGGTFASTDALVSIDAGSAYTDFSGLTFRNCSQGSALGRGLEISSSVSPSKANNLTFTNCTFYNIDTRAFGGGGNDIILQDSTFYNCVMENEAEALGGGGGWAAVISSFNYSDSTLPLRWTVRRCHVYDSWGEGIIALRIGGSGADGMDIYDCLIENTYSKLIYIDKAHGCDVYNNDLVVNDAAYNKNGSNADSITWAVEGTPVHANFGVDTINIYNNVCRGVSDGISWFTDSNTAASTYRNIKVFYNSMYAIDDDGWKTLAKAALGNTVTGCELRNNIIDGDWTINSATGWTYSHNMWLVAIPTTGTHTSSVLDDPEYTAPTTNDDDADGLQLQSTSPAIEAGTPVSITVDFYGVARDGTTPDMGAFEYVEPEPPEDPPAPDPSPTAGTVIYATRTFVNNTPDYQIWLARDDGTRLKLLDTVGPFEFTQVVNNVGYFKIHAPQNIDPLLLKTDRRINIWRKPPGGAGKLAFSGLLVDPVTAANKAGNVTKILQGPCLNDMLARVYIMFPEGNTTTTLLTDQADDMQKTIVSYNRGSSATTANGRKRSGVLSSAVFSVEGNTSLGPSITKAVHNRNVLDALREIADAAREEGTELYFGVVPVTGSTMQFRTRTGQWGMDRSGANNTITFGMEYGNLAEPILEEIYSNEINAMTALDDNGGSINADDTTRSGRSLFALREGIIRSGGPIFSTQSQRTSEAQAGLIAGRPMARFACKLLSVPGAVYGLDWDFGDRVKVTFDRRNFTAVVRGLTVAVDENGKEDIAAVAEGYLTL